MLATQKSIKLIMENMQIECSNSIAHLYSNLLVSTFVNSSVFVIGSSSENSLGPQHPQKRMSRSILPFRVTTNFNLGLFLKNEKSALRLGGSSTRLHSSTTLEERFSDVDDYVTHEYWSLDVEFLFW